MRAHTRFVWGLPRGVRLGGRWGHGRAAPSCGMGRDGGDGWGQASPGSNKRQEGLQPQTTTQRFRLDVRKHFFTQRISQRELRTTNLLINNPR